MTEALTVKAELTATIQTNLSETLTMLATDRRGFVLAIKDRMLVVGEADAQTFRLMSPINARAKVFATMNDAGRVAQHWNSRLDERAKGCRVEVLPMRRALTEYAKVQTDLLATLRAN